MFFVVRTITIVGVSGRLSTFAFYRIGICVACSLLLPDGADCRTLFFVGSISWSSDFILVFLGAVRRIGII